MQLMCQLVTLQLTVTKPSWDAGGAKKMLTDGEALLAKLRDSDDADSDATEELSFMLEIMHVLHSTHNEDQTSFGQTAEARLAKAQGMVGTPSQGDSEPRGGGGDGLWLPKGLRGALLHLVAAGVRRSNDTSQALQDVRLGEEIVDGWLARAGIFESRDDQPALSCAGCRTLVAHSALRMKSALAELGFHVLLTQCNFVDAAAKLYAVKQLAVTFPDTFPREQSTGRLAFFTAEYAYSVGELKRADEWCDKALPRCRNTELHNQCTILKALTSLEQDDLPGCLAVLEGVEQPQDEKAAAVQAVAAAKFARALRNHLQGQYQPAKTLGMQTFQCSKASNMQQTAHALCLLGEVYLALGAGETKQMLNIAIQTAVKLKDTLTHCIALVHLAKLAQKKADGASEAKEATDSLASKMQTINDSIAKAKVTWQYWCVPPPPPPTPQFLPRRPEPQAFAGASCSTMPAPAAAPLPAAAAAAARLKTALPPRRRRRTSPRSTFSSWTRARAPA